MIAIRLLLRRLRRDESGATAIEYGLIVALLAVFCIGAFNVLAGGSNSMWAYVSDNLVPALQTAQEPPTS